MVGNVRGRSSSPEQVPRAFAWDTCQIFRSVCVAHARTFPATGLDGSARQRPVVTSMGAVTPHSTSRWVFQKNTFTALFLLREIPPQIPSNPSPRL